MDIGRGDNLTKKKIINLSIKLLSHFIFIMISNQKFACIKYLKK